MHQCVWGIGIAPLRLLVVCYGGVWGFGGGVRLSSGASCVLGVAALRVAEIHRDGLVRSCARPVLGLFSFFLLCQLVALV